MNKWLRLLYFFPLFSVAALAFDTVRIELPLPKATTGAWHLTQAFVDVPEGSIRPQLITAPQSARQGSLQTGSVSVSFEISEKGLPFNIEVDKSSNEALEAEVIALIREWRFEAAMRDGNAIASHGHMDFSLGDGLRRPVRVQPNKR